MKSWTVDGYGFEYEFDLDRFVEFVKIHKESIDKKDLVECFMDNVESTAVLDSFVEDLFSEYEASYPGSDFGYGALVAEVMANETGIHLGYYEGENDAGRILFCAGYPWSFNEKEKTLTKDELNTIMQKYQEELGLTNDLDYDEVEYYG